MASYATTLDGAERSFFEQIQELLSAVVMTEKWEKPESKEGKTFRTICGVDAAYSSNERSNKQKVVAVASTLDSENGELLEQSEYSGVSNIPYVPGLFFMHEGPFATEAVRRLKREPNLVCFDAHGMSHPRQLGLATICGMVLKIPSIGIAKTKLVGRIEPYKRNLAHLVDKNGKTRQPKIIGFVSTKLSNEKKYYWSPGHAISIRELENIIETCSEVCLESIQRSHLRARKTII